MAVLIELKNVTKSFGPNIVLENISLAVEQGETAGLVGGNGSGKSLLSKILCGFASPDSGQVLIRGKQLEKGRDFPEHVGIFINSPGFNGSCSGLQNLKFLAAIQGIIGEKEIRETMMRVGLDPDDKAKAENYSLGMKQKLGLAQAIMEKQDILILDGLFQGLDYKTYEEMKQLVLELKAEGKTIFLTSRHCRDIEWLCDRIYQMEGHRVNCGK